MSQENVEVVQRLFAAWEGADLAGVLAELDPAMVTQRVPPAPDPKTYHGPEGLLQAGIDWYESFDELVMRDQEYINADSDHVIVRVRQEAHGERSGAPVQGTFWFLWTLRNRKITALHMYVSKEQAVRGWHVRPASHRQGPSRSPGRATRDRQSGRRG